MKRDDYDLTFKEAGDKSYTARADGKPGAKVWIVTKRSQNSTPLGVERVAAYFREELARAHAAKLVGSEGCLIGLETINVLDLPPGAK